MLLLSPVITRSGWIFGVAAPWQPGEDLIGYPMYYPHPEGTRRIKGATYQKFLRRIPSPSALWVQPYPAEPRIDPWTCRIPGDEIVSVIDVVSAFQRWLEEVDPRKSVLSRVLREANIPMSAIGIGGSTSLGCQQADADIDVLIFGADYASGCIRAIEHALLEGKAKLMSRDIASAYAARYGALYGLAAEYLYHVFAQDLTKIYVDGRKISFIFSYGSDERNQIPAALYQSNSPATVEFRARVVSNISSWYYPRKYLVQTSDGNLHSVWSHHWLHKAMALPGMLVEIIADRFNNQTCALTQLRHRILPLHG